MQPMEEICNKNYIKINRQIDLSKKSHEFAADGIDDDNLDLLSILDRNRQKILALRTVIEELQR